MQPLLAVHVDQIIVPEYRQRSGPLDRAKIIELADSFKLGRQIHPIVLRRQTFDDGERWVLVAGFRRLCTRKLVKDTVMRCGQLTLHANHIAATDWGSLSEVEQMEMELQENVLRVDLTIAEKAAAIGALERVRSAQAASRGQLYTAADLAEEARVSPESASVRNRVNETTVLLQLSKHLDDPQAAKIKNLSEAKAFLNKKLSASRNADLRRAFEATGGAGTNNKLLLGDSYDPAILDQLPQGQFDVACFDPPYGIGADRFGDQGGHSPGNAGHGYSDSAEVFAEVCNRVPFILEKLLRPEAHVYSFCADAERFLQLKAAFEFSGFYVWPRPLIWAKGRGIAPVPDRGPRNTYECILFAARGNKRTEILANDVLAHSAVQTPRHGAEKPVPLLVDLLMRSVRPGNLVVDLFAGSGSIFPAANAVHAVAWGIEREQAYFDLAVTRLAEKPEAGGPAATGTASGPLEEI